MKKEQEPEKERPGKTFRIGIDIDGIVAFANDPFWERFAARFGFDGRGTDSEQYYFIQDWPEIKTIPGGLEYAFELLASPEIYAEAKPVPGAIEQINLLRQLGHEIWFVTARSESLRVVTASWFESNNLGWAQNRIISLASFDPTGTERTNFKVKVAQELGLQLFIDDHAETIRQLDIPEMVRTFIIKYKWNKGKEIGGKAVPCDNWQKIFEEIQELSLA